MSASYSVERALPFDVRDGSTKPHAVNPHIFWPKDAAFRPNAHIPAPRLIAADIVADLEAALEQFSTIEEDLKP